MLQAAGGKTPRNLANDLLDAIDPDKQEAAIEQAHGPAPTPEQKQAVIEQMTDTACAPFDDPVTRTTLTEIKKANDIVIDATTPDEVTKAAFDLKHAEERVTSFKNFIEDNKDELTALQIIYNQSYANQKLTYTAIKDLTDKLTRPPHHLTTADVWQAYKRLDAKKVKGAPVDRQLTEIISLVRYALGYDGLLEPFGVRVEQRFNLWIGRQKKAGKDYTPEQLDWLKSITGFVAANAEITPGDFMTVPSLSDKGGIIKARQLFGADFNALLDDLQGALVA